MIIYKITNRLNNKIYIGLTTQSLEKRWVSHKAEGKRGNKKPLYVEMRKYGIKNFTIEEIDHATSLEELGELERKYIKQFDSTNRNKGYNLTYGGEHNELDANPRARLTTEEVITIRNYYAECKLTCSQCWEQLYKDKISFSAFEKIWEGTTWQQVCPDSYTEETRAWHRNHNNQKKYIGEQNHQAIYNDAEVLEIRQYYVNHSLTECFIKFGTKSKTKVSFRNVIDRSYEHIPMYSKKNKVWTLNGIIIDINCYINPVSTILESEE